MYSYRANIKIDIKSESVELLVVQTHSDIDSYTDSRPAFPSHQSPLKSS